jgi:hypothetical protein
MSLVPKMLGKVTDHPERRDVGEEKVEISEDGSTVGM